MERVQKNSYDILDRNLKIKSYIILSMYKSYGFNQVAVANRLGITQENISGRLRAIGKEFGVDFVTDKDNETFEMSVIYDFALAVDQAVQRLEKQLAYAKLMKSTPIDQIHHNYSDL